MKSLLQKDMTGSLLEVKNLTIEFSSGSQVFRAVDNISFSVGKGQTLGVVGESGSGKSVTSLSVMRLLPVGGKITSGNILFSSGDQITDLAILPENMMRPFRGNRITMIFQEPMTSLNPVISCGQQVAEALVLHKKLTPREAKERVVHLFEKVKLPKPEAVFDSYPHQLSGGQKQRVMIAMGIACEPDLLIADEPTTALDVTVQKSILELLKELQAETGMSMIFITHDLGVVASVADRVAVMYKGQIVEQESTSSIFSKAVHPYTKGLIACRPPLDRKLKRLPTIADFLNPGGEIVNYGYEPGELAGKREALYSKKPLLEVKGISKVYDLRKKIFKPAEKFKALENINFVVYPGETLGLVGESGCGKTTLGRIILRLLEPTAGQVVFKGRNLLELSNREMRRLRRNMQLVFQDPYSSLNPRMTIGEAITEPLYVHDLIRGKKERRSKVISLLERVGLSERHVNLYPHEFSGGQRQRICIARALAVDPEFLVCDESVSALDVSVQAQVLNLLNDLKSEFGLTYIFISHDLSVVKFMSDRVLVMNKGIIEEEGEPEELYRNPKSVYTKRLIESIPQVG
jgi:peptide/nickel transport system ATP-binding protein